MPVSDHHKDYDGNVSKWGTVRDCCEGSQAVKAARKTQAGHTSTLANEAGSKYLPVPNPTDNSKENRARYEAYLMRANFVNFTGPTAEAFAGMVFGKDPVIELAPTIEGMEDDANGAGESIISVAKRSIDEVLKAGRQGLLVDYPPMPPGATRAQTANILPSFKCYVAESIINWKTTVINGKLVLSMVVLKEVHEEPIDEFSSECKDRYRVLMLNEAGIYIQRMYNEDDELLVDENGETDIIPRMWNGKPWTEIPFVFIGATNNDPCPDKAPLYDIAEVNIAHYRNSADYEESCYLVGQPTPVISGLTQSWVDDVLKGRVEIGSRAAIALPEGGSAALLQAAPNQLPAEGMANKEKQLIQIGAKIITDSGQAETAEAAKIRFAGQNSKLATVVTNVEEAFNIALNWALMYAGGEGSENVFKLNTDFYDKNEDPQLIMAKIALIDRGVISVKDVRDYLRGTGAIDPERTDEDIEADMYEVSPITP